MVDVLSRHKSAYSQFLHGIPSVTMDRTVTTNIHFSHYYRTYETLPVRLLIRAVYLSTLVSTLYNYVVFLIGDSSIIVY